MAWHQSATCLVPDHHSERNFHPHINGSDMFGCGHQSSPFTSSVSPGDVSTNLGSFAQCDGHSTLTRRRHLLTHSSQVVLIIAIVFSMALVQAIFVQSSLFSTRPHASLLRSRSMTRLRQQFEMSCTGYRCNDDLTTNFAISSANAFMRVHRRIYYQCVFVLVRLRIVVIFDQQPVVT